jgi:hypothetical protein
LIVELFHKPTYERDSVPRSRVLMLHFIAAQRG